MIINGTGESCHNWNSPYEIFTLSPVVWSSRRCLMDVCLSSKRSFQGFSKNAFLETDMCGFTPKSNYRAKNIEAQLTVVSFSLDGSHLRREALNDFSRFDTYIDNTFYSGDEVAWVLEPAIWVVRNPTVLVRVIL